MKTEIKDNSNSTKSGLRSVSNVGNMKMKLSLKPGSSRRVKRFVETDRSKRVTTPIEAEMRNRELFGKASTNFHRQSRKLKARRTFALSPAPRPVTANKSGVSKYVSNIRRVVMSHFRKLDLTFLALIIIIAITGIIAVHSGSMTLAMHRRIDFLQISAFFVGITAIIILPALDISEILKRWKWIYIINIVLLLVTLVFGYSPTGDQNRSWINLGFTSIQPAEFSKVMFILSLSAHLNKLRDRLNTLPSLFALFLHGGTIIGLVLAERDWGNALVFIVIFITMLFCAKIDFKYFLGWIIAVVIAFPIIWDNLGDFRKRRVLIGFNPELDPQGYGHQVIRSRNAIASGGLLGQGYLNGETIQRPGALFAQHTDMVFAVIGQEFGFVGCAIVIAIYALLITRMVSTASKAGDYSGTYICSGVAGMFIFQFIINLGMALGVTPVVGITLPLISYGASSLIGMYVSLAFVMSVYANSNSYSYKSI